MNLEKYNRILATKYHNVRPSFLLAGKQIGAMLAQDKKEEARHLFEAYQKEHHLLWFEKVALSDLAALEQLMSEQEGSK